MSTPNIDELIDRYIKLRDRKSELKAKYDQDTDALDEAMEKIENFMLKHLNEQGADSIGAGTGTVFKSSVTSATVADWDATLQFIVDKAMWHLLDKRVNKTAVAEFVKTEGDLPPGVNWREETVVRIRRN